MIEEIEDILFYVESSQWEDVQPVNEGVQPVIMYADVVKQTLLK